MNIPRSIVSGLCLACLALCAACASTPDDARAQTPPTPAPAVDPQRLLGRWYVIADIPRPAEPGYVGAYVEYARRADGGIDDLYFGRKRSFEKPLERKALQDSIHDIFYVDADDQYALIGSADRSRGRIFARSPEMSEEKYHELLARFDQQGYDTARFQRVPQTIEQLGLPGFQTP